MAPTGTHLNPKHRTGFSLVEIVLALGIISFALVGILGMFPVALNTAKDSKAETIIAFIGQSIMADISGTKQTVPVGSSAIIQMVGTPPVTNTQSLIQAGSSTVSLDLLSTTTTLYLAYDSEGTCQKALSESEYNAGVPDAAYIVQLVSEHSPTEFTDLTRIQMDVGFPAAAPLQFRETRTFLRLIRP
ncbi:MAG: prepilin-type N-terminal cleavage/methylation domain-containing protein [Verrucomicrobiota bacterium]